MNYDKIAIEKIKTAPQPRDGYIRLSGPLEHDNIVNGDGLRAVVWTQGCPNHCPGCQNPETWDFGGGFEVEIEEICRRLSEYKGQTGLTFCGGEPFAQPRACKQIADYVRKNLGWNVWSFSGFTYEQIVQAGGEAYEFLKSLDALIDGPFILKQKDLSLRFRGSRNQRLLHLMPGTGKIVSQE
ncbi:anaerobic ribonucleoside-triphosphate reductase activating protein [Candidatus Saccharibacteria bacterium]|nr:anaerobic ribonucleoside-triphosphate reductase activating protein [Candidatus Saccharibacteria bacterium]